MTFDVASVKRNTASLSVRPWNGLASRPMSYVNFPLDAGDLYTSDAGFLMTEGLELADYINFAYKLKPYQGRFLQLPKWAATERYDIQARADSKPTKDQMRLMTQSLLADRFKLAVHWETRQLSVFALVLSKPGKTGPQLRPQSDDQPCADSGPPPTASGRPLFPCDTFGATQPGHWRGQRLTMGRVADNLVAAGNLDRPIVDRTGLSGRFDVILEFAPESNGPQANTQPGQTGPSDQTGPTFLEALRDQLGLKLKSQTGPVDVLVVDHVEEPSPN
jgi:uncharacterized protein (TIGR03435 family)